MLCISRNTRVHSEILIRICISTFSVSRRCAGIFAGENTKIIESSAIFGSEKKNKAITEYVEENENVYLAYVTDILQDERNRAIGLFEHEGIQGHPGDRGMKLIAERFLEKFKEISRDSESYY